MRKLPRVIGIATIVLMALAGCGDSDDVAADPATSTAAPSTTPTSTESTTASETPSTTPGSDLPGCTDVWVDGAKLPSSYQGCFDGAVEVKPEKSRCSSGQTIVTYADTFWAVSGAAVHETDGLDADSDYQDAKQSCLA